MPDNQANQTLENIRVRLLDLTARNQLINFKHTKKSLRVIDELPNQLVETLLSDKEMRFEAIPEPTEQELIKAGYLIFDEESRQIIRVRNDPTAEEWARFLSYETSFEVPAPSEGDLSIRHTDNAIQTLLYPYELEARLKILSQTAESAIQEMGANILYMAFGFLEWFENNSQEGSRHAPLFLVPVSISKGRLNPITRTYEYTLSYSGEDIIPNLSLREKLRIDFAIALPDLDDKRTPEKYFEEIQALISKNQPRWKIRRFISLTLLNFSKLLMYLDLDPMRWPDSVNIVNHRVVTRFLSGYGQEDNSASNTGFGEEHLIDEIEEVHSRYPLITDADSSQHSALVDVVNGKDLVIEGPPGTGKSQTITNIIAASISQGRSVLFMAEKLAALEVVRSRLDDAGLGDFCLELHSNKTHKRKVLDDIDIRLKKHGRYRRPEHIDVEISRYEELKNTLRFYAKKVNENWKNTGNTPHQIFMAATRYRMEIKVNPEVLHPLDHDGNNYDISTQRKHEDLIKAYRKVYKSIIEQLGEDKELHDHPWHGLRNSEIQHFDQERVKGLLSAWQSSLEEIHNGRCKIAALINETLPDSSILLNDCLGVSKQIASIPSMEGNEILDVIPSIKNEELESLKVYLKQIEEIDSIFLVLGNNIGKEALQDPSLIDKWLLTKTRLAKFVNPDVSLADLAEAMRIIHDIQSHIEAMAELIDGVSSVVGTPISISESGLSELKTIIVLISGLKPAHYKYRDNIFDNEELDDLLPKLNNDIEILSELENKIRDAYAVDRLPNDDNEFRQVIATLNEGGVFPWLRKEWRLARKKMLSYSVNPKTRLRALKRLQDEALAYSIKRTDLNQSKDYKTVLGDHFSGLDTDVTRLDELRKWYKSIRLNFGLGFGSKVSIGESIIGVSSGVAQAVRSAVERGAVSHLDKIQEGINTLKVSFSPAARIIQNDAVLFGEEGNLSRLHILLQNSFESFQPLIIDNAITFQQLTIYIDHIGELTKIIEEWCKSDIDNSLFQGRLGLLPHHEADNAEGISILRNTINFIESLFRNVTHAALLDYICKNPNEDTISLLISLADELNKLLENETASFKEFSDAVNLDLDGWTCSSGDNLGKLISRNSKAINNMQTLQAWLGYSRLHDQMNTSGLSTLAKAISNSQIHIDQLEVAYYAGAYDLLAREILREDPMIARFSGHSQMAVQERFREYDLKLQKLQREKIAWNIDKNHVPGGNLSAKAVDRTERALLEHECAKKTRHIPLRQLIQRSGNALLALKPCFMMGPMSVSQYLAPGKLNFDMIVMDEASQIKPQDALGAIARGAQLVVVGDPKQLPPTSFFDRIVDEGDVDSTSLEESESILDATLPMFTSRRLRWHYRSQHESLIAYSNYAFYDSDLIIFPSPFRQTEGYGIQYSRISRGCFVNRRNMEEARIISEAVREHLRNRSSESLGVVAMNAEQGLQIERAIETLAKEDVAFQGWLEKDASRPRNESLFIKNLENVQGDERDVIFISMTYGPQEPGGKVFQRFGPINSDVGWRRLNVLFTRSKKRMHIFSSMGSDDIVVSPSSKRGVKSLRDFLSFCETGVLHQSGLGSERGPDSDFEVQVISAIQQAGYECVPQVGVAGFFIDVAVVDPGNPGRYLMGIECDGATYHSAKSTRDRDRLRQEILERLGWRIRRIWSTDWYQNPHGELAPILRELNGLKTIARTEHSESEESLIEDIIELAEKESVQIERYSFGEGSLRDKLTRLDSEVIRKEFPDTPENKRLLRPSMLEALLEFKPTSKVEFLEIIPPYIRHGVEAREGKYLDKVFEIINAS